MEPYNEKATAAEPVSARQWGCGALLLAPVLVPLWFATVCNAVAVAAAAWSGLLDSFRMNS